MGGKGRGTRRSRLYSLLPESICGNWKFPTDDYRPSDCDIHAAEEEHRERGAIPIQAGRARMRTVERQYQAIHGTKARGNNCGIQNLISSQTAMLRLGLHCLRFSQLQTQTDYPS